MDPGTSATPDPLATRLTAARKSRTRSVFCSQDNAACEGFFGRLKTELFYPRNWTSITIEQVSALTYKSVRLFIRTPSTPMFCQVSPEGIDELRSLTHEQIARPKDHGAGLLLLRRQNDNAGHSA
jgi:transposase InsO family protein